MIHGRWACIQVINSHYECMRDVPCTSAWPYVHMERGLLAAEWHKRDMTLSDSKRSDMGTRVIAPGREWWRAVLTSLLTEGLALEWSKSIEWVKRLTTVDIWHVSLREGHVLWVLSHSCESYSWYGIIHTHRVVAKSLMNYTSTPLCLDHGYIHECQLTEVLRLRPFP